MNRLQRIATSTGLTLVGLAFFFMSMAAYKGVFLLPTPGGRYGSPRYWSTINIESSSVQFVSVVCFAVAGLLLLWLAYRLSSAKRSSH